MDILTLALLDVTVYQVTGFPRGPAEAPGTGVPHCALRAVGFRLWAVGVHPIITLGIGMRDHTKLKAYQLADSLALQVYAATRTFPQEERFGLVSQMRRSAVSVASNLVEGSARTSETEYIRFVEIAFASSRELQYQISLATRLGYLEGGALEPAATLVAKTLGALLKALLKSQH